MDYTWILVGLSLLGGLFNARQKTFGFVLWAWANAGWVVADLRAGLYSQAALFVVYFFISLYGIYSWRKKGRDTND